MRAVQHFKTITYHKWLVWKGCCAAGLYRQGILHDMSKYSPAEFLVGVRYYQGNRSPNNAEREEKGYSSAWLHHKGRNKHHYEYWIDYSVTGAMEGVPMPDKYIAEMVMDRIAACKVYMGKAYTDTAPLAYYKRGRGEIPMHAYTRENLEFLLEMLAEKGEKATFSYIKNQFLKKDKKKKE